MSDHESNGERTTAAEKSTAGPSSDFTQRKNPGQDLGQDHAQGQDGKILAAKFLASCPKIFPQDLAFLPLDLGQILPPCP